MEIMTDADIDFNWYARTYGAYALCSNNNDQVCCYHCDHEAPLDEDGAPELLEDGKDLYIAWAMGDIAHLINLGEGIRWVIFERNDNGKPKKYEFERFKRLI